ncbi:MAG: DUF177 domain-containing protein [Pseudomonadota bacterium]|nr:DUF177 domain-containing protein [Pseudomonadota bacterium]
MSEFAHRLTLDRIRDGDRLDLVADADERAAVAARLDLVSLERLDAHAVLRRDGQTVHATGRVKAALEQRCVATGDSLPVRVDEAFDLRFIPEPRVAGGDEEFELGADELDTLFHDGQAIDLGAAIADSLALGLDPYPRSAGAGEALRQAGVISEEEAGPFAALAALKGKLDRGD